MKTSSSSVSASPPEKTSIAVSLEIKPRLQPFEEKLAKLELASLAGTIVSDLSDGRVVVSVDRPELLRSRLAYWRSVQPQGYPCQLTQQVLNEASAELGKRGDLSHPLPHESVMPIPRRRVLRYGPHDLHEYRGRFFPQLVRALLNIANVPEGGTVLDPMCGSGTAIAEALLAGCDAVGVDLNPLSVLITRAKCGALSLNIDSRLWRAFGGIGSRLERKRTPRHWLQGLGDRDREYLGSWFAADVLDELDALATSIVEETDEGSPERAVFLVCLSNILRTVSFQDERDLRIRRSSSDATAASTRAFFLDETQKKLHAISALHRLMQPVRGSFLVKEGDARRVRNVEDCHASFDAIVTSPPYATALPYIDTDRLSLVFLGLSQRSDVRVIERMMIGNREVTQNERVAHWNRYLSSKHELPRSARDIIDRVAEIYHETDNGSGSVGFRRRNLPALLAKYFTDMRDVIVGFKQVLNANGSAFIVVGSNHTVAHGTRLNIPTEKVLADLANQSGMDVVDIFPMEMLTSREIFRKNVIKTESIIWLRPRQ